MVSTVLPKFLPVSAAGGVKKILFAVFGQIHTTLPPRIRQSSFRNLRIPAGEVPGSDFSDLCEKVRRAGLFCARMRKIKETRGGNRA
jgi:hypothetical protein